MATVLIVEDELLVQNVLQIELEEAGYDVILADNADAAIAILEARADIHLVFTDIDMPGSIDGLKLAACVRDRWPPIHGESRGRSSGSFGSRRSRDRNSGRRRGRALQFHCGPARHRGTDDVAAPIG